MGEGFNAVGETRLPTGPIELGNYLTPMKRWARQLGSCSRLPIKAIAPASFGTPRMPGIEGTTVFAVGTQTVTLVCTAVLPDKTLTAPPFQVPLILVTFAVVPLGSGDPSGAFRFQPIVMAAVGCIELAEP